MTESVHGERRMPTALVLALCSSMLSVGAVGLLRRYAFWSPRATGSPAHGSVRMRDGTAALAAETYLDAWRKRRFDAAMQVSVGPAQAEARDRKRAEAQLPASEAGADQLWQRLSAERLTYVVDETYYQTHGRVRLVGVAEGEFAGSPYRRRVEFTVEPSDDVWRVRHMVLGAIETAGPHTQGAEPHEP